MSFFEELKRRNVFRVGIAYVLLGWVVLQAADFALDLIDAPNWTIQALFITGLAGLPIALFFAWAFELTPEGIKREADVDRSESVSPHTGRKLDRAIIGFLILVVLGMGAERFISSSGNSPAETTSSNGQSGVVTPTAPVPDGFEKSIAVLPFDDMSQNQDQGWFADGLAEEILNALVRVPDLQVSARTSSFQYRDTDKPITTIADELGVAHVLEGSVRSAGERVRVTAQLIRASDQFHVWSETYDRDSSDIIAIQEDLARNIALALETTMDPGALADMAHVGTASVSAYQEYLKGLDLRQRALSSTSNIDGFLKAYEHFERARELDPGFSRAHVEAADFWKVQLTPSRTDSGLTDLSAREQLAEYHERIEAASRSARSDTDRLRIQADQAEVELRMTEALALFTRYLEARPNDNNARFNAAFLAIRAAQQDIAKTLIAPWRERALTDYSAASSLINVAYLILDADEAAEFAIQTLRRWPNDEGLLYQAHRTLLWSNRRLEAMELAERYRIIVPESSPFVEARAACSMGNRKAAEQILVDITPDFDNFDNASWLINSMLGNDEQAIASLKALEAEGVPFMLVGQLGYKQFDPKHFPSLMAVLEGEGIVRPPPVREPFACPPPEKTSIAVLAFENMSSDPEQDYFSDGITEEILNALAQVPDLQVAGRTSSFAFKGRNEDLRTIGNTLGVNHILEGSVRKAGDRVRITAQLIKTEDGFHLWSETFDRELTDVFAIQDEIAAAILVALENQLALGNQIETANVDLAVYDQYLQARQLMRSRSEANLTEAQAMLDQVIAVDPNYGPALAQRGITELMLSDKLGHYGSTPHAEALVTAESFFDQALALNPDDPDALAALGTIFEDRMDLEKAEALLLRALELSPNHTNAMNWLGGLYSKTNRLRQLLELRERLYRVDPLYPPGITGLMTIYGVFGEPEKMQPLIDNASQYLSDAALNYVKATSAFGSVLLGEEAEAIQRVQSVPAGERGWGDLAAAMAYARLGEYERALPYVENQPFMVFLLGRLGRTEEALQLAQRLMATGQGIGTYINALSEAGRHEEIISLVDKYFASIEEFTQLTGGGSSGARHIGQLVYAYRMTNQEIMAAETLTLYRDILEHQQREGADNVFLSENLAQFAMLENQSKVALDYLERAVDQGGIDLYAQYWPVFKPLSGEPRYLALRDRINDRRNEQRALIDLPPIEGEL